MRAIKQTLMNHITIRIPSDMGFYPGQHTTESQVSPLPTSVKYVARNCRYGIALPDTRPLVVTGTMASNYQKMILETDREKHHSIKTLFPHFKALTPIALVWTREHKTIPGTIVEAHNFGIRSAYLHLSDDPRFDMSSSALLQLNPALAQMEELGWILHFGGEHTKTHDVLDREVALNSYFIKLRSTFPALRIIWHNITDKRTIQLIEKLGKNTAATITTPYLFHTLTDMLDRTKQLHFRPVPKQRKDKDALVEAAISGKSCFFWASGSAPLRLYSGTVDSVMNGCFSAPCGIESIVELFEKAGAIEKLEHFLSLAGPRFYKLPISTRKVVFSRQEWEISKIETNQLFCWRGGEKIQWKMYSYQTWQQLQKKKAVAELAT